jgi:hypothetical protein
MTPLARLKFAYNDKGVLDPDILIGVLEDMEIAQEMHAAKLDGLEKMLGKKSPGTTPYINPEAH